MSEKRDIKDISLDIKGSNDTKELNIVGKTQPTPNNKLTKEDYLKAPTPEGDKDKKKSKPIDSSIYSRKQTKKG
jgi:hypothetical protein